MQSLPAHICSIPLKILKASHNHLSAIPCEIGLLSKLQSMVSKNKIRKAKVARYINIHKMRVLSTIKLIPLMYCQLDDQQKLTMIMIL